MNNFPTKIAQLIPFELSHSAYILYMHMENNKTIESYYTKLLVINTIPLWGTIQCYDCMTQYDVVYTTA